MGRGAIRNKPCWCGSGKKFKLCHQNRQEQAPVNPFERQKEYSKRLVKLCLHPDQAECSGNIVRAHTIQRNGGLSAMAEAGHVYGPTVLTKEGGRLGFRKIGLKKASTFTGFCSHHDSEVFAPIERSPFAACQEHAFLLAYRVICRELYEKQCSLDCMDLLREVDKGRVVREQVAYQSFLARHEFSAAVGLGDSKRQKDAFDQRLDSQDWSDTGYYVIRFKSPPDAMAAFGIFPSFDFQGRPIQDLGDLSLDLDAISVSLIATDEGGAFVLSWVNERHGACTRLAESIHAIPDAQVGNAIMRLLFEFTNNFFLRPSYWDSLAPELREALLGRLTTALNPMLERAVDCLVDDGRDYVQWEVVARETNAVARSHAIPPI